MIPLQTCAVVGASAVVDLARALVAVLVANHHEIDLIFVQHVVEGLAKMERHNVVRILLKLSRVLKQKDNNKDTAVCYL